MFEVNEEDNKVLLEENLRRLYVLSTVILGIELLMACYYLLVLNQPLYLSYVIIPLSLVNISLRPMASLSDGAKIMLIYSNAVVLVVVGGLWNVLGPGGPLALSVYMFMVAFVAGVFLLRPQLTFLLFTLSQVLFLWGSQKYPFPGGLQSSYLLHSVVFTVLAWAISVMLYKSNHKLIQDKNLFESLYATDRLTGLGNRHKLDEELGREINRAERYDVPLSLFMIDVDRFKAVNDEFGHLVGDSVLRQIAGVMQASLRKTDILGRWGGEEFMVICPNTDVGGAQLVAERVRESVCTTQFTNGRTVSLSIGLDHYIAGEGIESVVQRVDGLMYEAKHTGGNRVVTVID